MKKIKNENEWEASDSSPVDTKLEDDIGVRNQTTTKSKGRFPLTTIIVVSLLLAIVAFYLLFVNGIS
ncbi:MAG: hypothetical protein HKN31_08790 [Pricia sp.]|nr:hypothetical protein [Pricia sp.]